MLLLFILLALTFILFLTEELALLLTKHLEQYVSIPLQPFSLRENDACALIEFLGHFFELNLSHETAILRSVALNAPYLSLFAVISAAILSRKPPSESPATMIPLRPSADSSKPLGTVKND